MELARAIDEPGANAPPDSWDLLAEGHLRLGNPVRAGRLEAKGADRAEALGQPEKAASLRYKSGAYLFEAGKFAEADRSLIQGPGFAGRPRDLKAEGRDAPRPGPRPGGGDPRAGSLPGRLSRGARSPGPRLPPRPSTGEARWLLGQIRLAAAAPRRPSTSGRRSLTAILDGWKPGS